jgi:hypothetical protein
VRAAIYDGAALDPAARLGQLDEDDVAELVGGVGGDADGRGLALDQDPLVVGGVLELGGNGHGQFFFLE